MAHRLVGDGELAKVVSDHLGLDLHTVHGLSCGGVILVERGHVTATNVGEIWRAKDLHNTQKTKIGLKIFLVYMTSYAGETNGKT